MEFNFEQEPGKKQINPFCQTPCEALVSIITPFSMQVNILNKLFIL